MSEEIFCTSLRLRLRFVQKISKTINYKKMITFAKLIKTRKYTLFGTLPQKKSPLLFIPLKKVLSDSNKKKRETLRLPVIISS